MAGGILDLKGRIGFVTGAGQGVGRQIALHLAANGAGAVVVNDYYEERAKAVAAEVQGLGCKVLAASCDVTDFDRVIGAFDKASRAFGRVDILVNNAGNYGPDPSAFPASRSGSSCPENGSLRFRPISSVNSTAPGPCCRE